MIQKFKSPRDRNGNRLYLIIDTERREYARDTKEYIMDGIEIPRKAIRAAAKLAAADGYTERDRL